MPYMRKAKIAAKIILVWFLSCAVLLLFLQAMPWAFEIAADGSKQWKSGASVAIVILPIAFTVCYHRFFSVERKQAEASKKFLNAVLGDAGPHDPLFWQAAKVVVYTGQASTSMLQRKLNIEYDRAASLTNELEAAGIIGPFKRKKPRKILVTKIEYDILAPQFEACNDITNDVLFELQKIDAMEGHDFEHWCAGLLKKNGFSDVEVTRGSGDQGVDVLAKFGDAKYAIQCKCYSSDLGNKPVQEVNAGKTFYHCHIGVVMTNRYFTAGAKKIAEATGVLLWDRDTLIRFIKNGGRSND